MNRLLRQPRVYGSATPRTWGPHAGEADVIATPEVSLSGNVVLRVGNWRSDEWEQKMHVVLTPAEAILLVADIQECLDVRGAFNETRDIEGGP